MSAPLQPAEYATQLTIIGHPSVASVQTVVEHLAAALLRRSGLRGAFLLARGTRPLGLLLAALQVDLGLARLDGDLLVGAAGDPAALAGGLRLVEAAIAVGDTAPDTRLAGAEAAFEPAVERVPAALGGLAQALGARRVDALETPRARGVGRGALAARCQDRCERDRERGEDGAAAGHGLRTCPSTSRPWCLPSP